MKPSDLGIQGNENLVLGKHSGRAAFRDKVVQLGFVLGEGEIDSAFARFKQLCDHKKVVYDADIAAIVSEETISLPQIFVLESFQCSSSKSAALSALTVTKDGESRSDCALGNGAVDSLLRAVERVCGISGRLLEYRVEAVTSGKDAMASATVKVLFDGATSPVLGQAKDLDTLYATAKAYIQALNSFERMKGLLSDKRDLRYGGV